jgi:hypothetical protein
MRGMNGIVGLGELLGLLGTPVGFYEEWVPSHVRTTCTPKGYHVPLAHPHVTPHARSVVILKLVRATITIS